MLTKTHFTTFAERLSRIPDPLVRRQAIAAVADVLATLNPRFDRERFTTAANTTTETPHHG